MSSQVIGGESSSTGHEEEQYPQLPSPPMGVYTDSDKLVVILVQELYSIGITKIYVSNRFSHRPKECLQGHVIILDKIG